MALPKLLPLLGYLAKNSFIVYARPYKYTHALANVCLIDNSHEDEL